MPSSKPVCTARDDLLEGEATVQVLLGGVADLGVHHPVGGEVLTHSRATRVTCSARCMTATVWSKVSR